MYRKYSVTTFQNRACNKLNQNAIYSVFPLPHCADPILLNSGRPGRHSLRMRPRQRGGHSHHMTRPAQRHSHRTPPLAQRHTRRTQRQLERHKKRPGRHIRRTRRQPERRTERRTGRRRRRRGQRRTCWRGLVRFVCSKELL
jgi:hypothetical protein